MSNLDRSQSLLDRAIKTIPGGVNSPVRAFKGVGGTPVFFRSGEGAYLTDEDGNRYVDYVGSWGPMILGHAHPAIIRAANEAISNSMSFGTPSRSETTMARMICEMIESVEMVRMVNSGTEATMSAIRLARGFTGKPKSSTPLSRALLSGRTGETMCALCCLWCFARVIRWMSP